jgi:hypothetical protein
MKPAEQPIKELDPANSSAVTHVQYQPAVLRMH